MPLQIQGDTVTVASSKVKRTDYLGRCHSTRDDATIDAPQALNSCHADPKAKTNSPTASDFPDMLIDNQLRGSASPVELTTHAKTLETGRESFSNPSHRYLTRRRRNPAKRARSRTGCLRHRRRRL